MGGGQKLNKLRRKVGAVLIEFAFAIPVFLVLIYYIHDLPKQKLMQRKMQFVANETAAILQNMAMQKTGGAKITLNDLTNAMLLANLSVFPGMTQYSVGSSYTLRAVGYMPVLCVFYILGTGENTAQVKWRFRTFHNGGNVFQKQTSGKFWGSMINDSATEAESICPHLRIKNGEAKIIVEYMLFNDSDMRFSGTGRLTSEVSKRELFGFLIYNPQAKGDIRGFFNSVAVFTPAGASFSEELPSN